MTNWTNKDIKLSYSVKNIMKNAWAIAKKAAAETGEKASKFFAESLKMAWAEEKKPTQQSINAKLKLAGINATAKAWGGKRTYLHQYYRRWRILQQN